MSFIRKKKNKSGKLYAYEITATWDPIKKQSRSRGKYLGVVDDLGEIIPKGTNPRVAIVKPIENEKLIQDFGNGYLAAESIKKSAIYQPLQEVINAYPELISLMAYRLCNPSSMYNCDTWLNGNVLSTLNPGNSLSSQNISRILEVLGQESLQRDFFVKYLNQEKAGEKNIIIDATSLPNNISSDFNAWGYSDGGIEKQFRFHCVLDQDTQKPLFYRYCPGNIADVSTLEATLAELKMLGLKNNFALLDAGYFSETNLSTLYDQKIDFLIRMPSCRKIYKDIITKELQDLESLQYATLYGRRSLFIKSIKTNLYGNEGYAYIILDPLKKAKDINKLVTELSLPENLESRDANQDSLTFAKAGIFMLVSSKPIPTNEVMKAYYMRQSVEQVFGFAKSDLDLLPLRCHKDQTVRGYLFLTFLLLIVFIEIRKSLSQDFTVEQAMMITRQLKCKVFDNQIIVQELNKQQKKIFALCNTIVPTSLGI